MNPSDVVLHSWDLFRFVLAMAARNVRLIGCIETLHTLFNALVTHCSTPHIVEHIGSIMFKAIVTHC
jgi:hypothetical protein